MKQKIEMSLVELAHESSDLVDDYLDFCLHLKELGNDEVVPLDEFARWRNAEFAERDVWTNPEPSIH